MRKVRIVVSYGRSWLERDRKGTFGVGEIVHILTWVVFT